MVLKYVCLTFIVGLPEIRKNFYIEDPDVANMHPEEVAYIRYLW